jgi:hypothetical protein
MYCFGDSVSYAMIFKNKKATELNNAAHSTAGKESALS